MVYENQLIYKLMLETCKNLNKFVTLNISFKTYKILISIVKKDTPRIKFIFLKVTVYD